MTTPLDASVYRDAERLLRHHWNELVKHATVRPQWTDGGARFRYAMDGRTYEVDPALGTREEVEPAAPEPREMLDVPSPDGKQAVFLRDHDLWVRTLADGTTRRLTTDGDGEHEYGASPDYFMRSTLLSKLGVPHLPPAVAWSPDGTRIVTHRTDLTGVRATHMVDAYPADGGAPRLLTRRNAYPGDEHMPRAELVVLDVATGEAVRADAEPLAMPLLSPVSLGWVWWGPDGAVWYLDQPRDLRTLRLHRLDPATGAVREILAESGETRVEPNQFVARPMVRTLDGGDVLWYSQRDGWGHLYRYSGTGELRNQVTSGDWAVQEILHVAGGVVYFVAGGLVAGDPYRRTVCRVGLDGTGFARVTADDLDHVAAVPPGGAYFLDRASTVDTPPVTVVRGWDGAVLVELETADITGLLATGWTPPERFRVKAADGVTDIYGLLYRPHGFDPDRSYPVLDNPYPGPMVFRAQPSFDPGWQYRDAHAMAALGFVVVAVDGRGTPGRDKAFHDASYGRLGDAGGMADHVAALRQLAADRPWMDLDRVGAYGWSGGAFATVRAMADFPDVYRVAVAWSGNHDNRYYHLGWAETYDGPVTDELYSGSRNVEVADRITGRLLLVHGGVDDNVSPDQTLRLVDRMIAADADVDLLMVPSAEHLYLGFEHHLNRRTWDYLVRHLMRREPPAGYRLPRVPLDGELFAELFS
jgi:dipeptidyl-peptidase-4